MCEYCGCQQIPVIGELTAEHDAVVALIAVVRRALAGDDLAGAADATRRIAVLLGPHTIVEEDGLFPLMAQEFPAHVDVLRDEHRRTDAVLAESADGVPDDRTWPVRLIATLEALREHILKEQDGVFPAALSVVDADGWEHVERVRARAGSALRPTPPRAPHEHECSTHHLPEHVTAHQH
jgi:hemerythrin-like domain-containing protein